jgi:hypothetical protein
MFYAHRHRSILGAAGHIILPPANQFFCFFIRYQLVEDSHSVDGNGAQNTVTVQSGFRTRDLSITGPTRLKTALTGPTGRRKVEMK